MENNNSERYVGLNEEKLDKILLDIQKIKIALIGDICLDLYWKVDMTRSELSRETPHFPMPVVDEWMSLGAGGNVAVNISALKPKNMILIGVVGMDWRGRLLIEELEERGINTEKIIQSKSAVTNAYCKPLKMGFAGNTYEDARIDFGNTKKLHIDDEEKLIGALGKAAEEVDIICVSDQLRFGCITEKVRDRIIELAKQGCKVVVDSRDRIGLFTDVILKPNEMEGHLSVYIDSDIKNINMKKSINTAKVLTKRNNASVCMTLGSKGSIYNSETGESVYIPSYDVQEPIDICGAGDCFLSAFSCALATGVTGYEAASFANMASDVIIKKIGTTGTAFPDEIRKRYSEIKNKNNEKEGKSNELYS